MELTLSEQIRVLRERRGLTQDELAARVECSQGLIAYLETGRREPRLETLRKIAAVLDVEMQLALVEKVQN